MVTAIESRHYVEMAGIALDGVGDGSCSGVDGGLVALRRGRGARQRIQTYDALVRLRHDAGCDDRRQKLMETCKKTMRSTVPDGAKNGGFGTWETAVCGVCRSERNWVLV
jgi:hypothetical protein